MPLVSSGVEHGNIRELALARMKDFGTTCRDVRTREVGIQEIHNKVNNFQSRFQLRSFSLRLLNIQLEKFIILTTVVISSPFGISTVKNQSLCFKVRPYQVELVRRDYAANGGWETFLSYEDTEQDILVGLLRLRKCNPATTYRPELLANDDGTSNEVIFLVVVICDLWKF